MRSGRYRAPVGSVGRFHRGAALVAILLSAFTVGVLSNRADASPPTIDLRSAADASVFAGAAVTNTGSSDLNLDLDTTGAITGFPPGSTRGTQHVGDAVATTVQNDVASAYDTARTATPTADVTGVDLSGQTLGEGPVR